MEKLLVLTASVSPDALSSAGTQTGEADYKMLFCIIGLLVCIALPTAALLLGKLKYNGSFVQVLWAVLGYIVFSVILYGMISSIFLSGYRDQEATSFEASILIIIRIICEVFGMFLLLKVTKKRKGLGDAINFGAGYCLIECLMIGTLLAFYLGVLTGAIDHVSFLRELRVYIQDSNLVDGEEWKFFLKAFTALVFCALQMASAIVMFVAVQTGKYWYAGVPVIFGMLIRLPNRLHPFDAWFWGNYAVIVPYLGVMAVIIGITAYMIWKNNKTEIGYQKEGAK